MSKEIRILSAQNGGHLANELHISEYAAAIDMQKANTSMMADLLHINPNDVRIVYTSGGTFSIFQAMAVYVKEARERGVQTPVILASEFMHFAFNKSAELTGANLVFVPSDPVTK